MMMEETTMRPGNMMMKTTALVCVLATMSLASCATTGSQDEPAPDDPTQAPDTPAVVPELNLNGNNAQAAGAAEERVTSTSAVQSPTALALTGGDANAGSVDCAAQYATCGFAVGLSGVGCVASLFDAGATIAACVTLVSSVAACYVSIHSCEKSVATAMKNDAYGFKGSRDSVSSPANDALSCPGEDRVYKANFYWGKTGSVLSGIQLTCNHGKALTFGSTYNSIKNNTWNGSTCGKNNLIQGFDVWSGSGIDAMGVRCDKMFDTSTSDWEGIKYGGSSGGSESALECPEGRYVAGMKVWYWGSRGNGTTTDTRQIRGISLLCRVPA
jgi:hypothetical protein